MASKPLRLQVKWITPPSLLAANVQKYGDKVFTAVYAVATYIATQAQNEMRASAPWTDRTGNARSALFSLAEMAASDMVILYLSHGTAIYYGVFLETKYAGRYAVIVPTMQRILPQLERMLKDIFK